MKARLAATVALALGVVLGATGCSLIAPQTTTEHYDPSDGVSGDVGQVEIRNALLVSGQDDDAATLVAVLVNSGHESQRVEVQYRAKSGKKNQFVNVDPTEATKVDPKGGVDITLRNVDAQPGSLFPVFFQYGDHTGVRLNLPVLNNELGSYRQLAPTPAPVETETAKPEDSSGD